MAEGATRASRRVCMIWRGDMKVKRTALIQKGKMTDFRDQARESG